MIDVNDTVVAAIHSRLPDVSKDDVAAVLNSWNAVNSGDAPGTVLRDATSGNVAVRVVTDGIHMWNVTSPDGDRWNDLSPTLPWSVIHAASEGE